MTTDDELRRENYRRSAQIERLSGMRNTTEEERRAHEIAQADRMRNAMQPVTIEQLERAGAAVRAEQHYGRNTWPCEMDYADCRGCDAHTAVDGEGYCIQCASDREALHSIEMIEWEGFERIIWAGLLASVLLIGAAVAGTKLAGWW